jgi:hypothetical protein
VAGVGDFPRLSATTRSSLSSMQLGATEEDLSCDQMNWLRHSSNLNVSLVLLTRDEMGVARSTGEIHIFRLRDYLCCSNCEVVLVIRRGSPFS